MTSVIVAALAGLVVGGAAAWVLASARARATVGAQVAQARGTVGELRGQLLKAEGDLQSLRQTLDAERAARVKAETEQAESARNLQEQRALLEQARIRLTDSFKALSHDALRTNNQAFLELARKSLEALVTDAKGDLGKRQEGIDAMLKPLREALKRYEEQIQAIEHSRQKAYGGLEEQLKGLTAAQQRLEKEAHQLSTALRNPQVRGRWGEISLRRVAELAGMSEHCDFAEQVSVAGDARRGRPDMVVSLPAGRQIVVDAKVPLNAYLEAVGADTEEARARSLAVHARHMRDHMRGLAAKGYWEQFAEAPEFVVMFIPGESFFGAAVDNDPALIEDGMRDGVVLATPTTLIALLRAVAYGWRQEQLAQNAQAISDLGRQVYDRLGTLTGHLSAVGDALQRAAHAYNRTVASMEARLFPAARRFQELGVAAPDSFPAVSHVETSPRTLAAPEAAGDDAGAADDRDDADQAADA
ncbi:MAG: DNA recombination protein RmuC [Candidatus Brocadiaceae bacterium]|nr:DNA recombination protein RmuC [Candidatus Brocadiaceae bacterium]